MQAPRSDCKQLAYSLLGVPGLPPPAATPHAPDLQPAGLHLYSCYNLCICVRTRIHQAYRIYMLC